MRPRQALVHRDVGFGADEIALSAATRESAGDDDAWLGGSARRRLALVPNSI
jgi:hypothetical protein